MWFFFLLFWFHTSVCDNCVTTWTFYSTHGTRILNKHFLKCFQLSLQKSYWKCYNNTRILLLYENFMITFGDIIIFIQIYTITTREIRITSNAKCLNIQSITHNGINLLDQIRFINSLRVDIMFERKIINKSSTLIVFIW